MVRAFAPILAANGGGAILNVLSRAVLARPTTAPTPTPSRRPPAWSLTNGIRLELAAQGTIVTGVPLGRRDTDMMAARDTSSGAPMSMRRLAARRGQREPSSAAASRNGARRRSRARAVRARASAGGCRRDRRRPARSRAARAASPPHDGAGSRTRTVVVPALASLRVDHALRPGDADGQPHRGRRADGHATADAALEQRRAVRAGPALERSVSPARRERPGRRAPERWTGSSTAPTRRAASRPARGSRRSPPASRASRRGCRRSRPTRSAMPSGEKLGLAEV